MNFKKMDDCGCGDVRGHHPTVDDIKMVRISFEMPFAKYDTCKYILDCLVDNFCLPCSRDSFILEESTVTVNDLQKYGNHHITVEFAGQKFDNYEYELLHIINNSKPDAKPKAKSKAKAKPKKSK